MTVLEKLEARIKRLKQEPLGFNPRLDDECRLLEEAAGRIRELENYSAKPWQSLKMFNSV